MVSHTNQQTPHVHLNNPSLFPSSRKSMDPPCYLHRQLDIRFRLCSHDIRYWPLVQSGNLSSRHFPLHRLLRVK